MSNAFSNLVDLLRFRALTQPNQLAYTFLPKGDQQQEIHFTYKQLDQKAEAIATHLQKNGVTGKNALLLYAPGLDYIAAFFGCLYANVIAVPLYPPRANWSSHRFKSILMDAQIAAILTTVQDQKMIKSFFNDSQLPENILWLTTDTNFIFNQWEKPKITSDSIAYLQYTSGSTATPKGVILTHQNLLSNLQLIEESFGHSSKSIGVSWLPPYHDMGLIGGILQPLYSGFHVTLMSPFSFLQRPSNWLQTISRMKATSSGAPNFAYELCINRISQEDRDNLDLSHWEVAFTGAESIRSDTLEQFTQIFKPYGFKRNAFYPCYGLAEATLIASGRSKSIELKIISVDKTKLEGNQIVVVPTETINTQSFVSCGQPLGNQKIVIVDSEKHTLLSNNKVGEIWISGDSIAQGYYQRDEETQQTFKAYLADSTEGPFLRTGDLGFKNNDEIFITGRLKDLIIINGQNHYPQDIEYSVEQSHPAIQQNACAAFSTIVNEKEVLIIVSEVKRQYRHQNLDAVINAIKTAIANRHELSTAAVIMIKPGSIPKTSSGKIQRNNCRALFLARELLTLQEWHVEVQQKTISNDAIEISFNDIQQIQNWLIQNISNVLHIPINNIDLNQSIISYGFDSINAIELLHKIEIFSGVSLSPIILLQDTNITKLAELLLNQQSKFQKQILKEETQPEKFYPLSYAQQRLWFLQQLSPNNPVYNISVAFRIIGTLDFSALTWSFNEIVRRHDILRTNFIKYQGEPMQQVLKTFKLSIPVMNLQNLSTQDQKVVANREAEQFAHQIFNLEVTPKLAVKLLVLNAEERILLVSMHHIISDGWSMTLFGRELSLLYQGVLLPDLSIQYIDFVKWQRHQKAIFDSQFDYWQKILKDVIPLELPTDRIRQKQFSYQGAHQRFILPHDLTAKLKALAAHENATLFMTILAAFKLILYRYTHQNDITVGTPTANRNHPDLDNLIGIFVNTLVLRTRFDENMTVRDFIKVVRQVCLDAYAHQDIPFEQIVEKLNPERLLNHQPLFQVMLVLQNSPENILELPDLNVNQFDFEIGTSQFDLTLFLWEENNQIAATIEYAIDLFNTNTIQSFVNHFVQILQEIVNNPDQQIWQVPVLTTLEKQQLQNTTQLDFAQDLCIHELFETIVDQKPDMIALICDNLQVTYNELNQKANQLAHYLIEFGIKPNTHVGLCFNRSIDLFIALLATLKAGGTYVPIDPTLPTDRITTICNDAQMPLVLTQNHLRSQFNQVSVDLLSLDTDSHMFQNKMKDNLICQAKSDDLAYIIYTSGSTGKPKGVLVSHRNLVHSTTARLNYYTQPVTSFLLLSSFAFDSSIAGIFWTLCQGGKLILPTDDFQIYNIIELITQHQISHVLCIPSLYSTILTIAKKNQLSSLQVAIVAGEYCSKDLVNNHHNSCPTTSLYNEYGPTECTVWSSVYKCDFLDSNNKVSIGKPIVNTQIYILDKHLQPLPALVEGEIYIGGPGVAQGYLNQPNLTKQYFIPNPFKIGQMLYRTGDLAKYRLDGNLEFLGRIDRQVKFRGYRIELSEIETILSELPTIIDVAVIIQKHQSIEQLVAYLVLQPTETIDKIHQYLSQRLPIYMVPSNLVQLSIIPRNTNGKVNYGALPNVQIKKIKSQISNQIPNQIEKILTQIWGTILKQDKIEIDDNFFDLGGHSLLAMQLLNEVFNTFQQEISLRRFFEQPTIAQMAQILQGYSQTSSMIDIHSEAILDPTITIKRNLIQQNKNLQPQAILLTGATGFLGAFLLQELLTQTTANIYCLIRGQNIEESQNRLYRILQAYSLFDTNLIKRIIIIPGDLTQPFWGLPIEKFNLFASTIDSIYHCAATVNFTYPYQQLKKSNVLAVHEIIKFASFIKVKPLHYISTTSVFASNNAEKSITENANIDNYTNHFPNGYVESKWVAEKLVTIAQSRGFPVSIYRPGLITGDSRQGVLNQNDFLCRMIKGCIQLKAAPSLTGSIDMTPVDYVSKAIVYLSTQSSSIGKAFHVVNSQQIQIKDLTDWITSFGYPLRQMSYKSWRDLLLLKAQENVLYPLLSMFISSGENDSFQQILTKTTRYDDQNTKAALIKTDIICPKVDKELMHKYLSYLITPDFVQHTTIY